MILDRIVAQKWQEIERHKRQRPLATFIDTLTVSERSLKAIKLKRGVGLIAEFKRSSPSQKRLNQSNNLREIIKIYDRNAYVKAISVLTDSPFFGGTLADLQTARQFTHKVLLRKDFIIDEYQIYESRLFGADAILLIARLLEKEQLRRFIRIAGRYRMDCIVEVHDEQELTKIPANAAIIGINNRNLDTLHIDLDTTIRLAPKLKKRAVVVITESGIHSYQDVHYVGAAADAMLIGTSLLKADDINQKIDSLFRPRIKICGITRAADANLAARLGADLLGFIFYRKSPRYIPPQKAHAIIEEVKKNHPEVQSVGVFVNATPDQITEIDSCCKLDLIQFHGDETDEAILTWAGRAIRALRIQKNTDCDRIYDSPARYILLDTYQKGKYGGTGRQFDWGILDRIERKNIIIAGGINPRNVHHACQYQPYAIDVSSGVESRPGQKDARKLRQLFGALS